MNIDLVGISRWIRRGYEDRFSGDMKIDSAEI